MHSLYKWTRIIALKDGGSKKDTQQSSNAEGGMFVHGRQFLWEAGGLPNLAPLTGWTLARRGWFAEKIQLRALVNTFNRIPEAGCVSARSSLPNKMNLKAAQTNYPPTAFYD
jgi:hypothetical protein